MSLAYIDLILLIGDVAAYSQLATIGPGPWQPSAKYLSEYTLAIASFFQGVSHGACQLPTVDVIGMDGLLCFCAESGISTTWQQIANTRNPADIARQLSVAWSAHYQCYGQDMFCARLTIIWNCFVDFCLLRTYSTPLLVLGARIGYPDEISHIVDMSKSCKIKLYLFRKDTRLLHITLLRIITTGDVKLSDLQSLQPSKRELLGSLQHFLLQSTKTVPYARSNLQSISLLKDEGVNGLTLSPDVGKRLDRLLDKTWVSTSSCSST